MIRMLLKVRAEFSGCDEEGKCRFLYKRISCLGSSQGSIDIVHRVLVSTFFTEKYSAEGFVVNNEA